MSSDKHLLPKSIVPHHYEIEIDIDLKDLNFSGKQIIDVEVKEATNNVVFHSKKLNVTDVAVWVNDKSYSVTAIDHVLENSTISVTLAETLCIGKAQVHMSFGAAIKDCMNGLYYSKYTGVDGEERYMATTQFEADDARACFPCWDEPACKATFSISLVVDKTLTALSNMPEESNAPSGAGKRLVRFARTPVMSTYLVAIIVCDFEYVRDTSDSGVELRVYVQKGKQEQGKLALEICKKSLEYYEDYFQIPYPLVKLDLIGIPDFSMGAMENWGLVTFREVLLLFDPVHSSMQTRQNIAITVAHEIAHQWFGNLVTMQWWTHLWLNEGYATFMQYLCVDHIYPEMKIWNQYVVKDFDSVLGLDSLANTHPVEVEVKTSTEIDEIFDQISYEKGSAIIRMLHKYLGDEHFRKGMSLYLTRHAYGNTVTEDLWAALAESSGKPVQEMMETWTAKPGYPVVSVETCEYADKTVLRFSQERFYLAGAGYKGTDDDGTLWRVPIDVVCGADGETRSFLMTEKTAELTVPKLHPNHDWVKVNAGACGFYRTRYTPDLLARLGPLVLSKQLDNVDRLNLLGDLVNMVKSGHSSTVDAFSFMESYANEDDYSVFVSLATYLSDINWLLEHDPETRGKVVPLIVHIFAGVALSLGWELVEGEDDLNRLLRPLALGALGKIGYPPVLEKARSLLAGDTSIPADLRQCVYRTAALHCTDGTVQATLMRMFAATETPEEKIRISSAIVSTKRVEQLEKGIAFAMTELRPQDIFRALYMASVTSPQGAQFVWKYFKENVETFKAKFVNDGDFLSFLTKLITESFASEADARDIEGFFLRSDVRRHQSGLRQNLETIRLNARWLARDTPAILEYFAAKDAKP